MRQDNRRKLIEKTERILWRRPFLKVFVNSSLDSNFVFRATNKLETRISDTDVKVIKVEDMTSNLGNISYDKLNKIEL